MNGLQRFDPMSLQRTAAVQELESCNEMTARFGLILSETQISTLVDRRFAALRDTGRVEFEGGILKKLVYQFCDSPYINQDNYEEALLELQDAFYYFKNESMDAVDDDDLLCFMKTHFDTTCQGSLEKLSGTLLEDLARRARFGQWADWPEEEGEEML